MTAPKPSSLTRGLCLLGIVALLPLATASAQADEKGVQEKKDPYLEHYAKMGVKDPAKTLAAVKKLDKFRNYCGNWNVE